MLSDPYGRFFQEVLHPAWERKLRGRPTLEHLAWLERTQWASPAELHDLQSAALAKLLRHAWDDTVHYRRRFEQAGVSPDDVRDVDDLSRLPLLTREEAAAVGDERQSLAAPLPDIRKMTSGTSGRPLVFGYDRGSEYWRQATKLRGYGWAGYRPGDRSLHFWGDVGSVIPPPWAARVKTRLDRALRREHYVNCADHSESALAAVVGQIIDLEPSVLVCYAQAGAALARFVVETGCRDWKDIAVIACAERLFEEDRATLMQAFGPGIFETYGSREVMLIAAECPAHCGLHVSMENLVVEIIVREGQNERPALPGETGEVVITDLHNFGSPFIRYVSGDLAIRLPEGRCPCGRALMRLEGVEGRSSDTLRDGAGRPVGGIFFPVLFSALAHKVSAFQVIQRKDRSIDVRLVPGSAFDDSLLSVVRKGCEKVIPGVSIRTEAVADIPAGPGGKHRVVIVES